MHDNMASADEPASMECILKSELFPKKSLVCEDESLHVPFPLLCGEAVEYLGRTAAGVIALSNFRLLIRSKDSFINVPLGMVESIECREIFFLNIYCKDATVVRCDFSNNDSCQDWFKRITQRTGIPKELNSLFAFAFFAWCQDRNPCPAEHEVCYQLCQQDRLTYSFGKEVERMKFDLKSKSAWRITYINEDFTVCPSYPKCHIVPACITDKQLKDVAGFRSQRRFPSVVWRDQRNGTVLVRCSQPELGFFGWRSTEDETMLESVPVACSQNPGTYTKYPGLNEDLSGSESSSQNGDVAGDDKTTENKKMIIMDCRSYGAAFANRAKGGGVECAEYYPNAEIQFMNLANIHSIRKSYVALRSLCSGGADQPNWLSLLENSKWFTYLNAILKAAVVAVSAIDKEGKPVLVHCSDGWDRTTQIIALAELLLDPYYRTVEGFQILIEREWLDFGHKFADRCGNGINTGDWNERCPVFLQWLDCVYQLYHQFPCAFQFNEAYLVKLMQHTYSHLFGSFLCNNTREREANQLNQRTASVWSLLHSKNNKLINHLYCPSLEQQVLYPSYNVRSLELWASVYLSNNSSRTSAEDLSTDKQTNEQDTGTCSSCNLQKTRSCENLLANQEIPVPSPSRRKSDPSITLDNFDQAAHQAKDIDKNSSSQNISDLKDSLDIKLSINDSKVPKSILLENGRGEPHVNGGIMNGDVYIDNQTLMNGHSEYTDCDDKLGENVVQNGHMNGNISDSDNESGISLTRTIIKTISEKTLSDRTNEHGIDSSTDTLVEDENDLSKINGRLKLVSRSVENLIPAKTAIDRLKTLESSSTISTSTSEISNSSIELSGSNDADNLRNLQCLLHQSTALKLSCKTNGCVKQMTNGSLSPNKLYPTPASSRTPNSTCPPTPGADSKSTTESHIHRQLSGISRHLDVDGLTIFSDPVQQRMAQMKSDYERQIQVLTAQLDEARIALIQHASACNGAGRCILDNFRDDMLMSPDSNGEMNSLGGCSNASDVSWEQLDESDAKIVKWVPDYVVTHCAGCNTGFGIVKRKHHCRNCGNIFCHDCSNNYTSIPLQNLVGDERVCFKCYSCLQNKLPFSRMIDERPSLAAAASN